MNTAFYIHIGFPQAIYLALLIAGTELYRQKDGMPREGRYSFKGALMTDAIVISLMWWGGFFTQR